MEKEQVAEKKAKVPGVVFISHIPPGLTPGAIKSLLGNLNMGLTKTYIQPETDQARKRRQQFGGSSGLRYVEGWAEFSSKSKAKQIALQLNASRIGNKKQSRFYDDFWQIKYLSGFTWDMLREKTRIEKREQQLQLRAELVKANREDELFLESVGKSKKQKYLEENPPEEEDGKAEVRPQQERTLPKQLAPIREKRTGRKQQQVDE
ncbi:hypothetical protein BASA81_006442 [Batrachochytrium salamandrivorans]|nr:hypothetical protein BASA81_006442 [Batrachochytrium salamandrivorans]